MEAQTEFDLQRAVRLYYVDRDDTLEVESTEDGDRVFPARLFKVGVTPHGDDIPREAFPRLPQRLAMLWNHGRAHQVGHWERLAWEGDWLTAWGRLYGEAALERRVVDAGFFRDTSLGLLFVEFSFRAGGSGFKVGKLEMIEGSLVQDGAIDGAGVAFGASSGQGAQVDKTVLAAMVLLSHHQ